MSEGLSGNSGMAGTSLASLHASSPSACQDAGNEASAFRKAQPGAASIQDSTLDLKDGRHQPDGSESHPCLCKAAPEGAPSEVESQSEHESECSLMLLPDGRLLVRNVTPELSELLMALQPGDSDLARRMMFSESPDLQQITHSNA
ncbi:MAG: hypothetical protein EOP83_24350 [Verrucomicrobiaceae bacterium]|nr:MAG: hypothetical protein EOP83_24350 [Verrucomicrobiaceae bacterium]